MTTKQKIRIFIAKYVPFLLPLALKINEYLPLEPFAVYKAPQGKEFTKLAISTVAKNYPLNNSNSVHIVLYTFSLGSGGAERQWCYLANELSQRGYLVTFLVQSLEGGDAHYLPLLKKSKACVIAMDKVQISEETFKHCQSLKLPYYAHYLAAVLTEIKATHLLCQLDSTNIFGGIAGHVAGTQKTLLSFRSINPSNFSHIYETWFLPCYQALLPLKNIVWTGNSRFGCDDYAKWIGMNKDEISTIHNAITIPPICNAEEKQQLRNALNIPTNAPVILGVFRLSSEKNIPLFFNIIKKVYAAIPNLIVLHAGSGTMEEETKNLIIKHGLQDVVRLLGRREDITELMSLADVILHTSSIEGLSNVILEAQATSLPVVATNVCGMNEAVKNGQTGLLGASGNIEELTEHCLNLLNNTPKRQEMGIAAREFIANNFSHKELGNKTLKALDLPNENVSFDIQKANGEGIYSFPEAYMLDKVPHYISEYPNPFVVFSEHSDCFFNKLAAPKGSICFCLDPPTSNQENTSHLNWKDLQNLDNIANKIPQNATAIFTSGICCNPEIRLKLHELGIDNILFSDQGNIYNMPSIHPSIIKRVYILTKTLISKSTNMQQ